MKTQMAGERLLTQLFSSCLVDAPSSASSRSQRQADSLSQPEPTGDGCDGSTSDAL